MKKGAGTGEKVLPRGLVADDPPSPESPRNSVKENTGNYDDTAEVGKILQEVISAQSLKDGSPESYSIIQEGSKTEPVPSPLAENISVKSHSGKPLTEPPSTMPSEDKTIHSPHIEEGSASPQVKITRPATPPTAPAADSENIALKQECAMLKEALMQKNRLLSGGFARLNDFLKDIRSQLDQLQSHIDKLFQESLKEIRSPVTDKTSWPEYSSPVDEDTQWKPLISEIEKIYHKFSEPPLALNIDDWPARPGVAESEENREWDKTLVHLRRGAQEKRKREQKEASGTGELSDEKLFPEFQERKIKNREDKVLQSFGNVRKSLRRIQGLMNSASTGEDEESTFMAASESEESQPTQTGPEAETTISHSEKLIYRQYVKDMKHSDRIIRAKAAEALAKSRLKSTPEILMDAWCDESEPEVRSAIIKALVELEYKEAISFFTEALDENNLDVQMAALEGLYKFGTGQAIAGLLKAMRSRFYHIRRRAVAYLGWSRVETAFPQLVKMLKDENEFVRKAAISSLYSYRNKEAIPNFIELLHDNSLSVRKKVAELLYRWTGLWNDFIADAPGPKRLEGIENWKKWWKNQGGVFQISQIYRLEPAPKPSAPLVEKNEASKTAASPHSGNTEKPKRQAALDQSLKKKPEKQIKKEKTQETVKRTAFAKSPLKHSSSISERDDFVLASDITQQLTLDLSHFEKKAARNRKTAKPSSITEGTLQKAIVEASDGISLKELGKKLGVNWQGLTPKIKKLTDKQKIEKVGAKYLAKK